MDEIKVYNTYRINGVNKRRELTPTPGTFSEGEECDDLDYALVAGRSGGAAKPLQRDLRDIEVII